MAGNYTEAELDFWRKKQMLVCKVRDANKDGILTRADYMTLINRYRELNTSPDDEHFKALNDSFCANIEYLGFKDDSMTMTYDEFIKRFSAVLDGDKMTIDACRLYFSEMFRIIDTDGSGKIEFKEWVVYYEILEIDTAHARASFDAMDTNGDGVVSEEEFIAYNEEFFGSVKDDLKSSIMFGPLE